MLVYDSIHWAELSCVAFRISFERQPFPNSSFMALRWKRNSKWRTKSSISPYQHQLLPLQVTSRRSSCHQVFHFAFRIAEEKSKTLPHPTTTPPSLRRGESVRDRRTYNIVHKASMRHRSIVLDSNDAGLFTSILSCRLGSTPPCIFLSWTED